jgi:hypothetical protein
MISDFNYLYLADYLSKSEFYEVYPKTREIPVNLQHTGKGAFFDAKDNAITVRAGDFRQRLQGKPSGEIFESTNDLRGLRSVLAHEIVLNISNQKQAKDN